MKKTTIWVSPTASSFIEFDNQRTRTEDVRQLVRSPGAAADVFHVKLRTPNRVQFDDEHGARYNNTFWLRFYVPKGKTDRVFLLINGFAEGVTKVWDELGETLARENVASVLVPLPQHFCRNALFNIGDFDENDSYRVKKETLKTYNASLKFGLIANPERLFAYDQQIIAEIEHIVTCITHYTGQGDDHLEDFISGHFEPDTRCSILGFSLGGLVALQAFLTAPDTFNSCVLINSGASFQDMNASKVFDEDWPALQRGLLKKSREQRPLLPPNFERVFLGHEKVALHDDMEKHKNKILLLLGGSDPIFNRANTNSIQPVETGLAVFQIPSLKHFINVRGQGGDVWDEWSRFTAKMILAFDSFRPDSTSGFSGNGEPAPADPTSVGTEQGPHAPTRQG